MLRTIAPYLRTLRRLDREWQDARRRLDKLRALQDSMPLASRQGHAFTRLPFTSFETAEANAREAYEAHAAQEPELSAEFADRAALADANTESRRKEHALGLLLTARVVSPDPAGVEAATGAAARARAKLVAAVKQANAIDVEYQAATAASETDWHGLGVIEARAAKAKDAIGKAEAALAKAERQHRDAVTRFEARQAEAARRVTDIELARAELERSRAYAAEIRARLPETVRAPLKEPRYRKYGAPAPAELHSAIHERYRYEPATDTLHKQNGDLVKATSTIMIDGQRIPRKAVIDVLYAPPFNPEDLA